MFNTQKNKKGFSLLETVIFIGIAVFLIAIITSLLIVYVRSYVTFNAASRINTAALSSGDRITREIKLTTSVNVAASTFGTHPGNLVLNTNPGGVPTVIEFYLDGTTLKIKRDGVIVGALTGSNVNIDKLIFWHTSLGNAQIVSYEMNIVTSAGSSTRSATFLTSSAIRGAY